MPEIRLLGAPVVVTPTGPRSLRLREAVLLAYLAEHNKSNHLSREVVAAKFWPRNGSRGLRSLSQLLYQLREKAPDLGISPHAPLLSHAIITTDIDRLREHARRGEYFDALRLYQGPYLQNKSVGSHEIDHWLDTIRAELRDILDTVLQHCVTNGTTTGEVQTAARVAEALIASGDVSQGAYLAKIVGHIQVGQTQQAKAAFARMRKDVGFSGVYESIETLVRPAGRTEGQQPAHGVRFVGRADELGALKDCWDKAKDGHGQIVLITGEPGIGKTSLAMQFLRRVALWGACTWSARCLSATRRVPFFTLGEMWPDISNTKFERSAACRSFRALEAAAKPNSAGPPQHGTGYYQILDAFYSVMEMVSSQRPLVIFIDDIQWADSFTAQLLALSSLRVRSQNVIWLLTMRTQEADDVPSWITADLAPTLQLDLGHLSFESVGELVRLFEEAVRQPFPDDVRNRVIWQSGGRPFLLLEGMLAARDPGHTANATRLPATTEALLRARFGGLSEESKWICGTLAVSGNPCTSAEIAQITTLRDTSVVSGLEELLRRGIVECTDGRLAFSHDLMREVAYRVTTPARRALLHRRLAETLGEAADAGLLAQHHHRAGSRSLAFYYALSAARTARYAGRYADSQYYYDLAIASGEGDQCADVAREYARHLVTSGRYAALDHDIPQVEPKAGSEEYAVVLQLVELERRFLAGQTPVPELVSRAHALIASAQRVSNASEYSFVVAALFDVVFDSGSAPLSEAILDALRTAAAQSGDSTSMQQAEALGAFWDAQTVGIDVAIRRLDNIDRQDGQEPGYDFVRLVRGILYYWAGRLLEARDIMSMSLATAHESGSFRRVVARAINLGLILLEQSEFGQARRLMEMAASSPMSLVNRLRAYTNLAMVQFEEQAFDDALNTIDVVFRINRQYGAIQVANTAAALAGLISIRRGDRAGAQRWSEQIIREPDEMEPVGDSNYVVPFISETLIMDGRRDEAIALLDRQIESASRRDRICMLRLLLAKARILVPMNADQSYLLAKDVSRRAAEMGATLLESQARDVLSMVRG